MTATTVIIMVLIAIAVSIAIGWKMNINIGIIAMCFAFIIGYFFMDMSMMDIIKAWPTTIIFFILIVTFFFNFALQNGTLEVLSDKLLHLVKGKAALVPWLIFIVGTIISMLGAGGATVVLLAPIGFALVATTGQSPILIAMACGLAGQIGSDNPFNGQVGVIALGLIQSAGDYSTDTAFLYQLHTWIYSAFKQVLCFGVLYVIFRGWRGKDVDMGEASKMFNPAQKKTLAVIIIALLVIMIPKMINTFAPSPTWGYISGAVDPQAVMAIAALVLIFMKVGDHKKAIRALPMNMILLIAGVTMLMGVAEQAGLIEMVAAWISTSVPNSLVGPALVLIAGFMSFFAGGISVVCPMLYPMIPSIAAATGLSAGSLFTICYLGAMSTSSSPFSTGGAQTLGLAPENVQDKVFKGMFACTFLVWAIVLAFSFTGFFYLLG